MALSVSMLILGALIAFGASWVAATLPLSVHAEVLPPLPPPVVIVMPPVERARSIAAGDIPAIREVHGEFARPFTPPPLMPVAMLALDEAPRLDDLASISTIPIVVQAPVATVTFAPAQPVAFMVKYTADSSSSTTDSFGRGKGLQVWNVFIQNVGTASGHLTPEALYIAAPKVRWRPAARANAVLNSRFQMKPRNKIIRLLEWGGTNGEQAASVVSVMMAGKIVAASAPWQVGVASAVPMLHKLAQLISAPVADYSALLGNILNGPFDLAPGSGATYTAFASTGSPVDTISLNLAQNGTVIQ
jgi:hypothetical protein